MLLSIRHTTHYTFAQPVSHGLQRLRLKPKPTHGQDVKAWDMELEGARIEAEFDDQHNNRVTLVSVEPGVMRVTAMCSGLVQTADNAGVIGQHGGHMPLWAFFHQTPLTAPGSRMRALANRFPAEGRDSSDRAVGVLHDLSQAVLDAIRYETGHTDAQTTAEAALGAGHGVCQDHAHVFIGCARLLGFPARYVSGYLMMTDRIEQEAGHAWAEAFVNDLGWVGFDVSNGICPDEHYVRVATGRDYREAAPVTGLTYGAGETELSVTLAVEQQRAEQ